MRITFDTRSPADYRTFLRAKSLPSCRFFGRTAEFPDEYAAMLGVAAAPAAERAGYEPTPGLFDYQRDITATAIRKRKYAVFADCGLGKTLVFLEFARHVASLDPRGRILIVSPLMVVPQTLAEAGKFYGGRFTPAPLRASELPGWLESGSGVAITHYESLTEDLPPRTLAGLIIDESSSLKNMTGKRAGICLRLGEGVPYKLALTGTPAPNDRIEYANHAVFLDAFPTVNAFFARFFVNRGKTGERWEIKPHAVGPFYRAMSHWSVFVTNPATYGWKDNVGTLPPIRVHVHDVAMTDDQKGRTRDLTGTLFATDPGGIGSRAKMARIAKGGDSLKPAFIRDLIATWPGESAIVWCRFNDEQDRVAAALPGCVSVAGSTPMAERQAAVEAFKSGAARVLVTKPEILGFGLNLQVATRQVFSSLHDSYEEYYQAIKRSNRVGSTRDLNVHIPLTDVERPMAENVLRKADRVHADTVEQERIFRDASL